MTWIPSGSIRKALDPDLSNQEFNRLWHSHRHGLMIGYVLPMVIVFSRLTQIESLIDWYVARREKRRVNKALQQKTNQMDDELRSSPQTAGARRAA
jgi:uncharacterized protein (DUF2062 family)